MTGVEEFAYFAYAAAAVSAVAAVQQADTTRKAQHTNADIARSNADVISQEATQQVETQRSKARSIIGNQLASTAESGTSLSGSNLDSLNSSLVNNEADSIDIRYNASRNAQGLNSQANLDDMNASGATTGGDLSAAGSLLGGYARGASYTQQGSVVPGYMYGPPKN